MLMPAVDSYLGVRRAAGFALEVPEYLLRSFARFASARGESHVRTQTVIDWSSQAPSLSQRDHRLKTVVRFARHVHVEDRRHEVPPPRAFGYRKMRRVPFIYSSAEINCLIEAAVRLGPAGSIRPHTYSTLLALLSVTGLRISEALALRLEDVRPEGLIIRNTKFHKTRLVPLHASAAAGLQRYLARRALVAPHHDHVFVCLYGQPLRRSSVYWTFRPLLTSIGLDHGPNGRRPRIHDLRHSFAVRALQASPEGRDHVGRHMLALATYMGHTRMTDTYWYLEATPQLLRDIAEACQTFEQGERR